MYFWNTYGNVHGIQAQYFLHFIYSSANIPFYSNMYHSNFGTRNWDFFSSPHVLLFHEIAFYRISCGAWFLYHIKHHHFSTSLQLDVISNVWVGLHCKLRNHKSILCHELNIATIFQYCPQYGILMENCFLIFQMILSFFTSNFPIIQCIIITSSEMPIYLM